MNVASVCSSESSGPGDLSWLRGASPVHRHHGRNLSKATILFYRNEHCRVAVKSFADKPMVVRQLFGRWMINRETSAYERLQGVQGLPRFLGRVGAFQLATEWLEAKPLAECPKQSVSGATIDQVEEIVARIHQRGVALGDLHHRDVLLSESGQTWVIDLAAAMWLGERPGTVRRRVFERMRENDRVSLVKLRAGLTGESVASAVSRLGPEVAARYRRQRRVRAAWDRLRGKRRYPDDE